MTLHDSAIETRPRVRIAVPAWSLGWTTREASRQRKETPPVEEFKSLLEGSLGPDNLAEMLWTKKERRQMAISRRVRRALYGAPGAA